MITQVWQLTLIGTVMAAPCPSGSAAIVTVMAAEPTKEQLSGPAEVRIDSQYNLELNVEEFLGGEPIGRQTEVTYVGAKPLIGRKFLIIIDGDKTTSWLGAYGATCIPTEPLKEKNIMAVDERLSALTCADQ